ncbi:MAG: alpha/beta fold hydrolase [Vicinamibacterales bacterium]
MQLSQHKFQFEGIPVGYYRAGSGFPLLLLHGSGPGASSLGNWRSILEPLAARYEVFAMDLIGFGMSGRKPAEPYFDYPLWVRQAKAMLEEIPGKRVGLIGHSLSASIALTVADLDARVMAVVTTGAMGASFQPNEFTRRTWTCPRSREELAFAIQGLVFDRRLITEDYLRAREAVIFANGYADYFDTMFQGDPQQYVEAAVLEPGLLAALRTKVLLLHGRDDLAFPAETSLRLAGLIPEADAVLLGRCSHSIAFEQTAKFLFYVNAFFAEFAEGNAEA